MQGLLFQDSIVKKVIYNATFSFKTKLPYSQTCIFPVLSVYLFGGHHSTYERHLNDTNKIYILINTHNRKDNVKQFTQCLEINITIYRLKLCNFREGPASSESK